MEKKNSIMRAQSRGDSRFARVLTMLALMLTFAVTGAWAQGTVTFKNTANALTIENGKATVKVDGTAATVTEGKLTGVNKGSKVAINAKQGYEFEKVEAKKGTDGSGSLANITESDRGKVLCTDGSIYATKAEAASAGATAVAMIAYILSSIVGSYS